MEINKLYNAKWEDILPTIPDESVNLVFTDPPYNVSIDCVLYRNYRSSGKSGNVSLDFGKWDKEEFSPEPFLEEAKRILIPSGSIVVWTSSQLLGKYYDWLYKNMKPKQLLIWIKTNPIPQFKLIGYRQATEYMYWATKQKMTKNNPDFIFQEQENMTNVFTAPIVGGKERCGHPCQKPLSVCQEIIKRHCRPDGIVLDCFSGVATIPLAAYSLGRRYIGIEMDEKYHRKGLRRIKDYKIKVEEETEDFEQIKMF